MRLASPRWLAVVAAPFLASCVFLLDYDDLQSGPAASTDGASLAGAAADGGRVNAAGSAGGQGGSPVTCANCDDEDA